MFIVVTEISHNEAGDRILTPIKVSIRCVCAYFTRDGQTIVIVDKNMLAEPSIMVVESEEEIDARIDCVVEGGATIGNGEAAAIWSACLKAPTKQLE
jgi:hypothetical protein